MVGGGGGGGGGGRKLAPVTFHGEKPWKISIVCRKFFGTIYTKYTKSQHFHKCIYILSIYVCSLSGPGTILVNLKGCKIVNATGATAKSKKVRDVFKGGWGGGSPEERPYDVSRGQNRFVTLPLAHYSLFTDFTLLNSMHDLCLYRF